MLSSLLRSFVRNFVKFTGKQLCQRLFFNLRSLLCSFYRGQLPGRLKYVLRLALFHCEILDIFHLLFLIWYFFICFHLLASGFSTKECWAKKTAPTCSIQDIFWTSFLRLKYVMYPRGTIRSNTNHPTETLIRLLTS